jgi:hypothetical protein
MSFGRGLDSRAHDSYILQNLFYPRSNSTAQIYIHPRKYFIYERMCYSRKIQTTDVSKLQLHQDLTLASSQEKRSSQQEKVSMS